MLGDDSDRGVGVVIVWGGSAVSEQCVSEQ